MTAAPDPAAAKATDSPQDAAGDTGASPADLTTRDRFKDALARKQAKSSSAGPRSPGAGKDLGSTQSDKRQRQFRRKSGG